jgi:hypothetical protein
MKKQNEKKRKQSIPLSKVNYAIFGIGILVLVLGYISLSQGPVNSFWSLTLAPILLVIGYCVIIPVAILYRGNKQASSSGD